jgi:hypothetical protein
LFGTYDGLNRYDGYRFNAGKGVRSLKINSNIKCTDGALAIERQNE